MLLRGQLAARGQRLGRLRILLLTARFRLPVLPLHLLRFLLALPQQHFQKLFAITHYEPQLLEKARPKVRLSPLSWFAIVSA